jgi:hypothetical protein
MMLFLTIELHLFLVGVLWKYVIGADVEFFSNGMTSG